MNQHQMVQAIARATGESPKTVQRHGFSILRRVLPEEADQEDPRAPLTVDWDQLALERNVAMFRQR